MQQRVCGANSTLSSVHGGTLLNSGTGGGGYPPSGAIHPCTAPDNEFGETSNSLLSRTTSIRGRFAEKEQQVCGSFGAGAEKPASDDAGTGKRLEPETVFCAVLTSTALFQQSMLKRVCASANIAY